MRTIRRRPTLFGAAAALIGLVGIVIGLVSVARTYAANPSGITIGAGVDRVAEAQPPHWNTSTLTYRIANCPQSLDCAEAQRALRDAFAAWDAVSGISLSEVRRGGDIIVSFEVDEHGDGTAFDGPGGFAAHAIYPYTSGAEAIDGDIHFDDTETWVTSDAPAPFPREAHLPTIALHEIGHALGVPHSDEPDTVMWPTYVGPRTLTPADVRAIQEIFGTPDEEQAAE